MTGVFWLLLALGYGWQGVFLWLYLERPGDKRLFYKAATTAGPALIALAGAGLRGAATDWLLLTSVLLFVAADALLEIHMAIGVLLFLAGHVGIGVILLGQGASPAVAVSAGLVGLSAVVWVHRKRLVKLGKLMLVYVLVLFAMLGAALSCAARPGAGAASIVTALGSGMFVASDMLLGDAMLRGYRTRSRHWWIMGLYESAVLLLALAPFGGV